MILALFAKFQKFILNRINDTAVLIFYGILKRCGEGTRTALCGEGTREGIPFKRLLCAPTRQTHGWTDIA